MRRISRLLLATTLLAASAIAQQQLPVRSIEAPIQWGGVYHVASGYMERGPSTAILGGSDAIYDNTCEVAGYGGPYYLPLEDGALVVDGGRLPSTTSPSPNAGTFDRYRVKSFMLGYRTFEQDVVAGGPGAKIRIEFWQQYADCASTSSAGPPTASFTLTGLPASVTAGTASSHYVAVDLTGMEFDMLADGDGDFDSSGDLFGWSFSPQDQVSNPPGLGTGPLLAPVADIGVCAFGASTYYNTPSAASGEGLDNADFFRMEGSPGYVDNCYWVGGPPYRASFYMELNADLTDCNGNALPDAYDISSGGSTDINANGVPDECECGDAPGVCGVGTSLNGCTPTIATSGTPSASNAGTYFVTATGMDGNRLGGFLYGFAYGPINIGAAGGGTSWFCGPSPRQRVTPSFADTGGTAGLCDGSRTHDLNDFWFNNLGAPYSFGTTLWIQGWNRDPGSASMNLNVTDGIAATMCP